MFHILETRPTKVRWCWLARERDTSTASPMVSTVLVLRVAILGGCRNPARCGTPCTCALWNTTSAATSLRCSSESRGLTDSNWAGGSGGSAASTSRRARRWMLSSLLVCEAAHDIQERELSGNSPGTARLRVGIVAAETNIGVIMESIINTTNGINPEPRTPRQHTPLRARKPRYMVLKHLFEPFSANLSPVLVVKRPKEQDLRQGLDSVPLSLRFYNSTLPLHHYARLPRVLTKPRVRRQPGGDRDDSGDAKLGQT
ncbi:hypothetical protein GWK47_024842 [Chionoecetes opilio]|uniref:Uncharacterized protein n=1 Tax=Chionoecetes opilio TaxID=41210 RepID=A0A8J5BSY7_CHIOP|nr:hypothetical protein GWK47_024842 [Chionoecetes opilio]